jgi:hypothetical protein
VETWFSLTAARLENQAAIAQRDGNQPISLPLPFA